MQDGLAQAVVVAGVLLVAAEHFTQVRRQPLLGDHLLLVVEEHHEVEVEQRQGLLIEVAAGKVGPVAEHELVAVVPAGVSAEQVEVVFQHEVQGAAQSLGIIEQE